MGGQQRMQRPSTRPALRAPAGVLTTRPVSSMHGHIMVRLGPVEPDKQHLVPLSWIAIPVKPEGARGALMDKCSTLGTPPHQPSAPSATSGGTI